MKTTKRISERICATKFDHFPPDVVEYSKNLALSALGAMISGSFRNSGRIMKKYVERVGGRPEASVMGMGFKTNVETAAMANATFAHATEYEDDSFPDAVSSYTIFPAVLALGEKLNAPGKDIIESFVVGYETQARIALACPDGRRRGILMLSLAGTLGCTAAAAKLLKLDVERTTMALSLAASQGGGIAHQTGTHAHTFEMGISGRDGLTAALLGAEGFTGQPDIFEAPRGLFDIITGGKIPKAQDILDDWGNPFRIMEIGIKMYPCCYHLQRLIEGTLILKREHKLSASDIEEVKVDVNLFMPQVLQYPEPRNEDETQFSLPHAIAAAFLEEKIIPNSFGEEKINDMPFKRMRRKVKMIVREEWGWGTIGWSPIITIVLKNGEKLIREHPNAKGQPPNLLSFEEVIEKYKVCTESVLDDKKINKSVSMVRELDYCKNIVDVIREVTG